MANIHRELARRLPPSRSRTSCIPGRALMSKLRSVHRPLDRFIPQLMATESCSLILKTTSTVVLSSNGSFTHSHTCACTNTRSNTGAQTLTSTAKVPQAYRSTNRYSPSSSLELSTPVTRKAPLSSAHDARSAAQSATGEEKSTMLWMLTVKTMS